MLVQSASRYLRRCCARATGARAADTLPAEKFSAFCEDKKEEEAGNPGVVFMKSGFIHGKVSNTRSFFCVVVVVVIVGFEAHTVCASTPFRRFSPLWKRVSSRETFSRGFVSAARGDFHAWKRMKYIYIYIYIII